MPYHKTKPLSSIAVSQAQCCLTKRELPRRSAGERRPPLPDIFPSPARQHRGYQGHSIYTSTVTKHMPVADDRRHAVAEGDRMGRAARPRDWPPLLWKCKATRSKKRQHIVQNTSNHGTSRWHDLNHLRCPERHGAIRRALALSKHHSSRGDAVMRNPWASTPLSRRWGCRNRTLWPF